MKRLTGRVVLLLSLATLLVGLTATPALAHGIGGRADLPVPLEFFVVGAGIAIVVSFLALAMLWPESRLQGSGPERNVETRWLPRVSVALTVVGLVGFALVVVAGVVNYVIDTPPVSEGEPLGMASRVRR